jgi:hypothetical protein
MSLLISQISAPDSGGLEPAFVDQLHRGRSATLLPFRLKLFVEIFWTPCRFLLGLVSTVINDEGQMMIRATLEMLLRASSKRAGTDRDAFSVWYLCCEKMRRRGVDDGEFLKYLI